MASPTFLALVSVILLKLSFTFSSDVEIDLNRVDNTKCGEKNGWLSVESDTTVSSGRHKDKVLKATSFSCASFDVVTPDTIVVSVYIEAVFNSRVEVLVHDKYDVSILNHVVYSLQGWNTITLPIVKDTTVNVTLLGFSQDKDKVLIESIIYNQNLSSPTIPKDCERFIQNKGLANLKRNKREKQMQSEENPNPIINEDENEFIIYNVNADKSEGDGINTGEEEKNNGEEVDQGSGEQDKEETEVVDESEGNEEEPNGPEGENGNNNGSFWNVWTITLVSVTSVVLTAIVVVGAYYLGRNSGKTETTPPIDLADLEAPRIIPRARPTRTSYERFGGSDYGGSNNDRG